MYQSHISTTCRSSFIALESERFSIDTNTLFTRINIIGIILVNLSLKMWYNFLQCQSNSSFFSPTIGARRIFHLYETTNGTIRVNAVARPFGSRGTNGRETRERHRYILFPCDGVANPIKDVPTGGRPIRLSPGWRSPLQDSRAPHHGGPFSSPKGNDSTWKVPEARETDTKGCRAEREGGGGLPPS